VASFEVEVPGQPSREQGVEGVVSRAVSALGPPAHRSPAAPP